MMRSRLRFGGRSRPTLAGAAAVITCLAATLSGPAARPALAASPQVVLYQSPNFRGTSMVLPGNWPGGGAFDRRVRSVRVPAGYRVTLFAEPNYGGTRTELDRDWSTDRTSWWGSRVRSIRVVRVGGPVGGGTAPGDLPTIYAGEGFSGPWRRIDENWPGSPEWDGSPHRVVSLRVPPGWRVQGFSEPNYIGESITLLQDWMPHREDRWYGRMRSIAILDRPDRPTGGTYPAPAIFAREEYAGASRRIEDDWPGESNWGGLPYRVVSIRVPRGWAIRAYDEPNWRGESIVLSEDWSPRATDRWWGRVRSIRVLARGPWSDATALPMIYAGRLFDGESIPLRRDWPGEAGWNGNRRRVMSIRVPQGWQLVAFTNPNYKGRATLIALDWQAPANEKERIRSIRVYRPGETPVVPR